MHLVPFQHLRLWPTLDQYHKLLEILVIILDYLSSAQDYFISSTESSTASSVIVSILTADISSRESTADFLSRGSTAEFSSADSKVTSSTAASTGTYSIQNNLTTIIKTRMTIFIKAKL